MEAIANAMEPEYKKWVGHWKDKPLIRVILKESIAKPDLQAANVIPEPTIYF